MNQSTQVMLRQGVIPLILAMTLGLASLSWGQGSAQTGSPPHPPGGGGFMLGLCVGQTLAKQGTILPLPVAGQPPSDADIEKYKTEIDAAKATCISEFPPPPSTPSN